MKSDIFESDEEDVEIEISPVLPSTPNTASSVSTSKSARMRMKSLFTVSPGPLPVIRLASDMPRRALHTP